MRPQTLHVGGTVYWVLQTYNPDTGVLKDAESTPTVAVRKNGASVGDSVTVTKRSATTGIYDCSYNPAAEVEGDSFTLEESATVTGTTTSSATYSQTWGLVVMAVERGTDSAATPTNVTDAVTSIKGADGDTLKTLSDQIDGIGSGTGTGARTVTVTVNDGATVLQNAAVRLTEGANSFKSLTNVSGVVTFNVDDATYTVGITKSGYTYAGTTLVVDGTEAVTYSMTAVSSTPPDDPALCAVTIHLRDQYGNDLAGEPVEITFVQFTADAAETPPVLSIPPVQTTSAGGLVEVELYRDAVYKVIYGSASYARRIDITVPDAATYEVEQ